MKDIICVTVAKDHTFECACDIIGRAGESETARLEITVPHSFTNWWTYIEFGKPNGELCRTPNLEVANGVANYDIPLHLLTESGEMEVQLVFQKESGEIWKSSKKKYIITESLNATDDIPEKEDFITEAQAVLDELSGEVQEIADALANDPDFADAVIEACGGQTKIITINGTPLSFFVGTQAEYEALTEAQKKNLFAIITNDTAKEELLSAISRLQEKTKSLQTAIDGLEGDLESGELVVKKAYNATNANNADKATSDANGNDITRTYGNFNGEWKSGFMEYPQLYPAVGTYLFSVSVTYNAFDFLTSFVVYWDGKTQTIITLPTMRNSYGTIFHYRLVISADGSTHIQYFTSSVASGTVTDWTEIDYFNSTEIKRNVSVRYRKIL